MAGRRLGPAAHRGPRVGQAPRHRLPRAGRHAGHSPKWRFPFAGYRVTAYTNDEEDAVGLREKARWTVEDELVKMGVDFTRGEIWKPYTVVDRNLYTGQNPASAAPLAQEMLKALK